MPKREPKPRVGTAEGALLRSKSRIESAVRRLDVQIENLEAIKAERQQKLDEIRDIDVALKALRA